VTNSDQETVLRAIEDAKRILGEYVDGPRDAAATVERLLAVLDRDDVVTFSIGLRGAGFSASWNENSPGVRLEAPTPPFQASGCR
jgi:hypothetical protein